MAFRTNKVPAIEERTVSGSSVSFNSAFALPLKACKVSFEATQAGSGDPSPSNPRAISGVSAIGLTANSTPVSVSLGEERFGGELDVLTGILIVTHRIRHLTSDMDWRTFSNLKRNFYVNIPDALTAVSSEYPDGKRPYKSNMFSYATTIASNYTMTWGGVTNNGNSQFNSGNAGWGVNDWKSFLNDNDLYIVYDISPITIQLSANELSSIIGNNTFSTDTGTLEIKFQDLQEKSASGSVATFNTALAMPLVNGEFSIEAYQEGTGEPSPTNVRAIHGYSSMTITANDTPVTVNLGQDVYGGTYNSVSGKKNDTQIKATLRGSMFDSWSAGISCLRGSVNAFTPWSKKEGGSAVLFSHGLPSSRTGINSVTNGFFCGDTTGGNQDAIFVKLQGVTDLASGQAYIEQQYENGTPLEIVYKIDTPIEIQLTPTQINTIIGNNNIFCDTGDTSLTFNDLDIAKRGNFREVFKLPS